ncbi:hypothetical protein [Paenibacillus sp. GCM10027626]|uniref:hypothetical protein n=1 Tax=Paenibacillus sp. GCM10027626 TaxID=3273411 RepID=UPI003632B33C
MGKIYTSIMISMLLAMVLTACQKDTVDYRNEYDASTDFPYMFQMQGDGILVAPTDKGYYFLNGSFLYYADKINMKPVLLDNRPENDCMQASDQGAIRNCYAYVKHDPQFRHKFLGYHDGKLYTLESGEGLGKDNENRFKTMLIELSEDGSTRKVKMEFDSVPRSMAIHRGMLYYTLRSFDKESNATSQLMQVNLKGSGKPVPIYTGNASGSEISDITPYGKNIYFYEIGGQSIRFMRYDLENRTATRLFTDEDGRIAKMEGIYNNRLMYVVSSPIKDESSLRDEEHLKVFSSDLEGRNGKELPIKRTFFSFYYVSGNYFYARPVFPFLFNEQFKEKLKDIRHELTVYDQQYNIVDKIDMSFLPIDHSFMVGDDRYAFVQIFKDGKIMMQYLDKSEFGTGKAAFKPLLESPDL